MRGAAVSFICLLQLMLALERVLLILTVLYIDANGRVLLILTEGYVDAKAVALLVRCRWQQSIECNSMKTLP